MMVPMIEAYVDGRPISRSSSSLISVASVNLAGGLVSWPAALTDAAVSVSPPRRGDGVVGEPAEEGGFGGGLQGEDGAAMFPDAVTARGLAHLRELAQVVETGARAVLLFVVSRADASRFEPADHIDPAFGAALRTVVDAGVEPLAYTTTVRPDRFELRERIPVALPARASR